MFTVLSVVLIAVLVLTEVYCIGWLIGYATLKSDERADARRENFRRIAYRDMHIRRTLSINRQKTWDFFKEV